MGTKEDDIDELSQRALAYYLAMKSNFNKWKKSGLSINPAVRALIIVVIVFQAFFPLDIKNLSWTIVGVLLLVLVLFAILIYVAGPIGGATGVITGGGKGVPGGGLIIDLIVSIIAVLVILFLAQLFNCGTHTCLDLVAAKIGIAYAVIFGAALVLIGAFIGWKTDGVKFVVAALIFWFVCFVGIYMITMTLPSWYYGFCKNIPLLYGSSFCQPRETTVALMGATKQVQVSGGLDARFGEEQTGYMPPRYIFAGEPYIYNFNLQNKYADTITFSMEPSITVDYEDAQIIFTQSYTPRTSEIGPNEFYQDEFLFEPEKMSIKADDKSKCSDNAYTQCIDIKNDVNFCKNSALDIVDCASDKPCEDPKKVCVENESFRCQCVDWNSATCGGYSATLKMDIHHTGVFRGEGTLYYYDEYWKPIELEELKQGPLGVTIVFLPNPFVKKIHENYLNSIGFSVMLKNHGTGKIKINSFSLTTEDTKITLVDKEKGMKLEETVGTQLISCDTSRIEGLVLSGGKEIYLPLCSLSPPHIESVLTKIEDSTVVDQADVTYDKISDFCSGAGGTSTTTTTSQCPYYCLSSSMCSAEGGICDSEYSCGTDKCCCNIPSESSSTTTTTLPEEQQSAVVWSENWEGIKNSIGSGFCDIVQNKATVSKDESETIQNSLAYTKVMIEIEYEMDFEKPADLNIYKQTIECENLFTK